MTIYNNPNAPVSLDGLAVGRTSSTPFLTHFAIQDPTTGDVNYPIQQRWFNTSADREWILIGYRVVGEIKTAIWEPISSSVTTETLSGNSGGPVSVDGANNINVIGSGDLTVTGNPGTHTLTISQSGTVATSYVENAGTAIPAGGVLNVLGGTGVTTSGAGNTITINASTSVATSYVEDTGSAVPSANILNIVGGTGIHTSGAGNTVTITNTGSIVNLAVKRQVFTTSGTYTPTAGMSYCDIEVVGGGGGGGGAAANGGTFNVSAGAGGGAGGYAKKIVSAAGIGASQTVTIGAAGAASAVGNNPGGTGGTTSVGVLVSATGGTGGAGSPAQNVSTVGSIGGTGGVGSNGDLNANGAPGGMGSPSGVNGIGNLVTGGVGASSIYGGGAVAVSQQAATGQTGNAATLYGSGGGGAVNANINTDFAGGAGSAGVVIITEYIV